AGPALCLPLSCLCVVKNHWQAVAISPVHLRWTCVYRTWISCAWVLAPSASLLETIRATPSPFRALASPEFPHLIHQWWNCIQVRPDTPRRSETDESAALSSATMQLRLGSTSILKHNAISAIFPAIFCSTTPVCGGHYSSPERLTQLCRWWTSTSTRSTPERVD
ncbi:hypothetical protein B0H16DRAFT_107217, partial [Mycena metata]